MKCSHERIRTRPGASRGPGTLAIYAPQSPAPSTGAVMTAPDVRPNWSLHQGTEYSPTHNLIRFGYERCGSRQGFQTAKSVGEPTGLFALAEALVAVENLVRHSAVMVYAAAAAVDGGTT